MAAVSLSVRDAVRVPRAEGVKDATTLQLCPEARVFGLIGQFEVSAKSPGALPPEIPMLLIVKGLVWRFLTVAVSVALVVPTAWLANNKLAGVAVIGVLLGGTWSSYTMVVEFAPLFSMMSKIFVLALKAPMSSQLPPDVGHAKEFN